MTDPAKSDPKSEPYPQDKPETKAEQLIVEGAQPYAALGTGKTSSVQLVFRAQQAMKSKL